jgi:hypothetical protein
MNMNRIMTAFALSGLLMGAPAFAKSHKPVVATAGDKAAGETKAEGSSETKTETAKPKKVKKAKKAEKTEGGEAAKPAEAPAK